MLSRGPEVSVALVGIGGYGNSYLSSLLDDSSNGAAAHGSRLIAVVDPSPARCKFLPLLAEGQIPIFSSLQELLAAHSPSLVIISSPLHLHCEQTVMALNAGCHVLCEKPLAASPAQVSEMIKARDRAGRQVSIGYQWSFSSAIQSLKRDIAAGVLGTPRRLKTLVLWPRDHEYYHRNNWVGKRYTLAGQPIFDSPLNNACAHHLHNMMYVLGDRIDHSAAPRSVTAEIYRANDIETFDTAAVRVWTTGGVEVLCTVSHATRNIHGPRFSFEFENATVFFDGEQPTMDTRDGPSVFVHFSDGRVREYGSPERDPDHKLWSAVDSARRNSPTVCGIEASLSHVRIVDALRRCIPEAATFPASLIQRRGEGACQMVSVTGLDEVLSKGYATGRLPHEMNVPWSVAGQEICFPDTESSPHSPKVKRVIPDRVQIFPAAAPAATPSLGTPA